MEYKTVFGVGTVLAYRVDGFVIVDLRFATAFIYDPKFSKGLKLSLPSVQARATPCIDSSIIVSPVRSPLAKSRSFSFEKASKTPLQSSETVMAKQVGVWQRPSATKEASPPVPAATAKLPPVAAVELPHSPLKAQQQTLSSPAPERVGTALAEHAMLHTKLEEMTEALSKLNSRLKPQPKPDQDTASVADSADSHEKLDEIRIGVSLANLQLKVLRLVKQYRMLESKASKTAQRSRAKAPPQLDVKHGHRRGSTQESLSDMSEFSLPYSHTDSAPGARKEKPRAAPFHDWKVARPPSIVQSTPAPAALVRSPIAPPRVPSPRLSPSLSPRLPSRISVDDPGLYSDSIGSRAQVPLSGSTEKRGRAISPRIRQKATAMRSASPPFSVTTVSPKSGTFGFGDRDPLGRLAYMYKNS